MTDIEVPIEIKIPPWKYEEIEKSVANLYVEQGINKLPRDLPNALQVYNVFRSRWCGAYWQSLGMTVIPNVSWGDTASFDYCFDGVEEGSIVAVGMIGCKRSKLSFMRGYNEMLMRIKPTAVVCFGTPFAEMQGNIISVDYNSSRRVNRNGR